MSRGVLGDLEDEGDAGISDELEAAGYSQTDTQRIKQQVEDALDVREIVRKASGETLDLKPFEADMRHLIDTYIICCM